MFEINKEDLKPTIENSSEINLEPKIKEQTNEPHLIAREPEIIKTEDEQFVIEKAPEEEQIEENIAARLVADFGEFDPTLELSKYK